jgi:hypothetical protein
MTKTQVKILVGLAAAFAVAYLLVKRKEIEDWARKTYYDAQTKVHLMSLHPTVRQRFSDFISAVEIELGYRVLITSSFRSFLKQEEIAKGEGQKYGSQDISQHNFGFAIDMNAYGKNGLHISSTSPSSQWQPIAKIAKRFGIDWGGVWGNPDKVHFEYKIKSASELLSIYNKGNRDSSGYVKLAA